MFEVADALEFECREGTSVAPANDLHAIASVFVHCMVPTADTELLRTQLVLTQPPRPIWNQVQ